MKWINRFNIDPVIAQAVMTDDYEAVGDISITRLVRPPQITYLEHKHEDELEQDVVDGLFALEGRALHHILEGVQQLAAGNGLNNVGPGCHLGVGESYLVELRLGLAIGQGHKIGIEVLVSLLD